MQFNCIKINIDEILNRIRIAEFYNGKEPSVLRIAMCSKTIKYIEDQLTAQFLHKADEYSITMICGVKVIPDESIDFGMFEILKEV